MLVPTMAFATPPPLSPAGTGFLVKKFRSSEEAPFTTRFPRIRIRDRTARNESTPTSPVITPFTTRRRTRRGLTARGFLPRAAAEPSAAVGDPGGPHRLLPRGPHPEGRLALARRHGEEHLARHGGDVGHDHDREDHAAREQRVPVEDPVEERRPPEHGPQWRD